MLLSWLWLLPGRVCVQENLGGKPVGCHCREQEGVSHRAAWIFRGVMEREEELWQKLWRLKWVSSLQGHLRRQEHDGSGWKL